VLFWLFDCFVAITVRYVSVAYRPDAITLSDVLRRPSGNSPRAPP
jgi:hypothetical protein